MAKILIWMSPEPGHILPTLKFARDLQSRGHSVTYHTCTPFHPQLRRLGFECYPLLDPAVGESATEGLFSTTESSKEWYEGLANRFNQDRVLVYGAISDDIGKAAIETEADLVLIDSLMNYLYGIQVDCSKHPRRRVGFIQTNLPLILFGKNMARTARLLRRADRTIILCPKELEIPEFEIESGLYAEPSIHLDRSETYFPWEWLDPDRKLIYCALGSQSSLYPEAVGILRAVLEVAERMSRHQFVISAGPHLRELSADTLSPRNLLILASVPQTNLLERASVMIMQGGLGSIKECIYFGVPMLVIPFVNDQPLNAERVCRHGLGLRMAPVGIDVEGLHGAIDTLLEDRDISSNIKSMQGLFQTREMETIAASMCEELLVRSLRADTGRPD